MSCIIAFAQVDPFDGLPPGDRKQVVGGFCGCEFVWFPDFSIPRILMIFTHLFAAWTQSWGTCLNASQVCPSVRRVCIRIVCASVSASGTFGRQRRGRFCRKASKAWTTLRAGESSRCHFRVVSFVALPCAGRPHVCLSGSYILLYVSRECTYARVLCTPVCCASFFSVTSMFEGSDDFRDFGGKPMCVFSCLSPPPCTHISNAIFCRCG